MAQCHHGDGTHWELSSLFILFSSRMWRFRTLSKRSSSAWISASSYNTTINAITHSLTWNQLLIVDQTEEDKFINNWPSWDGQDVAWRFPPARDTQLKLICIQSTENHTFYYLELIKDKIYSVTNENHTSMWSKLWQNISSLIKHVYTGKCRYSQLREAWFEEGVALSTIDCLGFTLFWLRVGIRGLGVTGWRGFPLG